MAKIFFFSFLGTFFTRIKKGFFLLTSNIILGTFAFSFIPIFLKEQGFSPLWLIFLYALYSGFGVLMIPIVSQFYLKTFLFLGFIFSGLAALAFAFLPIKTAFVAFALLIGINLVIFWIPLNFIFFRQSEKQTNARDSFFYMAAPGLISMAMPLLGAWVIQTKGYQWMFTLTGVGFLVPLFFLQKLIGQEFAEAKFMEGIRRYKSLKIITLCEGALQYFSGVVIPIYGLFFLRTESDVGRFLGYLGLIGFVIALLLAHRSDHTLQRKKYVFVLFLLMAATIAFLSFVHNIFQWYLAVGIFTIISTVSSPLRLAISLDSKKSDLGFWKTREFFLNLGRVITLGVTMIFFWKKLYWLAFIMYAGIALMYPFLVKIKLNEVK